MKKLMIAAAIVCAAALSQAATVSWTAAGNALYNADADATHYCAYLVDVYSFATLDEDNNITGFTKYGSVADVAAALKAGTFEGKTIYKATSGNGIGVAGSSTKTIMVSVSGKDTVAPYTKDDPIAYYAILFNNGDVTKADQFLAETPTVVASKVSSAGAISAMLGPQVGKTWAAIPEPTSGLLLLLGVAGLALKRRRA